MIPRDAIRKKLILEALLACRGNTIKESALLDQVNFDADPPVTRTDFEPLLAQLEKSGRITRVSNPDGGQHRAGITANGVAALSEM